MRVRLAEDSPHRPPNGGVSFSRSIAVDQDRRGSGCTPCGADGDGGDGTVGELFTLRVRERSYYSEDGDPRYTWTDLGSGRGLLSTVRKEADDASGNTTVTGQLTMAWVESVPPETAVVDAPNGHRWRISAVTPLPGALRLTVERVEDVD